MSLTQRAHEDSYWKTQNGHSHDGNGGLGSKLNGYGFGDKRELPMYKDKPYNYAGSKRTTPFYLRWRIASGAILTLLALAYFFGVFSSWTVKPKSRSVGKSSWNWLGGQEVAVDWDERREKVKEAFILSWDGYEKYAWGMSGASLVMPQHIVYGENTGALCQPEDC